MFRIPFPVTDTTLVLTPPLESLPGWAQIILGVLGLAVAAGLLIWLYSYELKLVRPLTATGLLALRAVALALLWFVIMQPVVARPTSEKLPGYVLIALDRSDSMGVTDPQRDNAEKLRLARGLGLARDLVKDGKLDDWIKQYADQGRVGFAADAQGEADRAAHNQICTRIDNLTRTQIAQNVLAGNAVVLVNEASKRHGVEVVGFSQEIGDLAIDEITSLPPSAGADGKSAYTDLRLPLLRALERSGRERGKVLGVIL